MRIFEFIGASEAVGPSETAPEAVKGYRALHSICRYDAAVEAADAARGLGPLATADPGRFWTRMGAGALKELFSRVGCLLLNEREFEALLGGDPNKAFDLGVSLVVVKRGAAYSRDGRGVDQPAFKVEAVDTTGSGDAFDAAFVVSALEGRDLEDCLRRANAAGALKAARKGARSAPTREGVERPASR